MEEQVCRPLLQNDTDIENTLITSHDEDNAGGKQLSTARRIYVSHFLSAWNSRVFEFGAVLYLAFIFPNTLLPVSVYALARGLVAVIFSPAVGHIIDTWDRLVVVRFSIVVQRITVAISCVLFWVLVTAELKPRWLLVLLAGLACAEKLCSIMNYVSVEKDWIVIIAQGDDSALQALNAQMRRIDLFCKLAGPLAIGLIDSFSTEVAIIVNFTLNLVSIPFEYYAIAKVYQVVPELKRHRLSPSDNSDENASYHLPDMVAVARLYYNQLRFYCSHRAFLASFSCSLLYFTVLSFAGQMNTYLLSAGYNSLQISILRTICAGFEISSTWIAPIVIGRIGPIRAGIWFIGWLVFCLAGAVMPFWLFGMPSWAAASLIGSTILSRVGLWGFDLSVQVIVQAEVEPTYRGTFSTVEAVWQNIFELCSYSLTMVFSRPTQFYWPVTASYIAVIAAGSLYTAFVRVRRGHLFHTPPCIPLDRK